MNKIILYRDEECMKKIVLIGLTLLTISQLSATRPTIQSDQLHQGLISQEMDIESGTPMELAQESQGRFARFKASLSSCCSPVKNGLSKVSTAIKNKWNGSITSRETVENAILTGITGFTGWYWGGSLDYSYPLLINSFATISANNVAETTINQNLLSKILKTSIPATAAFLANYYGLIGEPGQNPYMFNEFFLALCFGMMHELKIASGRLPVNAKTWVNYAFVRNWHRIPQRIREAFELTTLETLAVGITEANKAAGENGIGTNGNIPLAFTAIAGRNIADMVKDRPYWQQSLMLLPPAAVYEAFNYFVLSGTHPEAGYMLFFGWLVSSIDRVKELFTKKKQHEHSEAPTEVVRLAHI